MLPLPACELPQDGVNDWRSHCISLSRAQTQAEFDGVVIVRHCEPFYIERSPIRVPIPLSVRTSKRRA